MWPRVVEIMLGLWLAASPFIFSHSRAETAYWYTDLFSAFSIITFGLLSYSEYFRFARLGTAAVGLWLVGFVYFGAPYPTPPPLQNNIVVGMLLVMIVVIPNEASEPPRSWKQLSRESNAGTE